VVEGPVGALIGLALGRHVEEDVVGLVAFGSSLFDAAHEHRVVPLLWETLATVPGVDRQRVAAIDLQARHRYRIVEEELLRVSEVAASVGVQIGVVKGVVNAERWFASDPSVRPCSDIDLFLDPTDPGGTDRLLQALDPANPLCGHAGHLMARGVLPDIPVTGGRVLVEIHANPMTLQLSSSRVAALWNSTEETITRAGGTVRCLDTTTALVHALINTAKDNHAFLLQVLEVGRAVQDPLVDWARFEQIVGDNRWDAVIDDAIGYVCAVLELPRPPFQLRPEAVSRWTMRRLAPLDDRLGGRASWRRAQRFCKLDLVVPGTRTSSVRGIVTRTFSPDEYITAFAPDLTGPYPLRAARFWVRRQQYVKGTRSSLSGPLTKHG
jgi:Uncharacterised nucleotidyltransferase